MLIRREMPKGLEMCKEEGVLPPAEEYPHFVSVKLQASSVEILPLSGGPGVQ